MIDSRLHTHLFMSHYVPYVVSSLIPSPSVSSLSGLKGVATNNELAAQEFNYYTFSNCDSYVNTFYNEYAYICACCT